MRIFLQIFAALVVLLTCFCAYAVFCPTYTSKTVFASNRTVYGFLQCSQSHDYKGAHLMLSRRLQSQISPQSLAQQWKAFETAHGAIRNWAGGPGGVISIWPRYFIDKHTVSGRKGGSGLVTMRLLPEGKIWRIDQLAIKP